MFDTNTITQNVKIQSLLGYELKKAGAYYVGACPFCGGVDRFTVKPTALGDRWHCRQCGDGRYHDVIDFLMRRDDVDFKTAAAMLAGGAEIGTIKQPVKPQLQTKATIPGAAWQAQAWRHVDKASSDLLSPTGYGVIGYHYLETRGISRATMETNHLGHTFAIDPKSQRRRQAVVIPWIQKADEIITAVKYRFIDDDPDGVKYANMAGSMPALFGGWDTLESNDTVIFIEGEINALSIWQCQPRGVSVLSFGSDVNMPASMRDIASGYKRVIVWCDDTQRAQAYEDFIKRPCKKIESATIDGAKHDANQFLQRGQLVDFLRYAVGVVCAT